MTQIVVKGCRPEPLGAYLTGLGIFRLVAEQVDAQASAWWAEDGLYLESSLNLEALRSFFLEDCEPTPLVSPWNGGSGFAPGRASVGAADALAAIESSQAARLQASRQTIAIARTITAAYADSASFKAAKRQIMVRCRALLPDQAVTWLDAAVVLTTDDVAYPYILGTGGNLGRLDLTANVNEHIAAIMDLDTGRPTRQSAAWLNGVLTGELTQPRVKRPVGQFDPGSAGGVNFSTHDGADALVNPWQFLLTIEGALLFASAAARRLGTSGDNVAAMPFTVRAAAVGSGHLAVEESAKGELWLPLWEQPVTLAELRRLMGEGRLRWGGRQATASLDAARAIATLGADRGIASFARYTIAERLGQSPLAVPSGRVRTGRSPSVGVTADLDPWLKRVRRAASSQALAAGVHKVDRALLVLATSHETESGPALGQLLFEIAQVDQLIGTSRSLRTEVPPLRWLDAQRWLPLLDDGTDEFAVAAGFASLRVPVDYSASGSASPSWRRSFAQYLRPITWNSWEWTREPRLVPDPLKVGIAPTAAQAHRLHARYGREVPEADAHLHTRGIDTVLSRGRWVSARQAEGFVTGALDDVAIARWVHVLCLIQPAGAWPLAARSTPAAVQVSPHPLWQVLVPLHAARPFAATWSGERGEPVGPVRARLGGRKDWPTQLIAASVGAPSGLCRAALTQLRVAGLRPVVRDHAALSAGDIDGQRMAAALLLRLPDRVLSRYLTTVTEPPDLDAPFLESTEHGGV